MIFKLIDDNKNSGAPIIKVIGVGGGGSNAVNHMFKQGIVGVDFAICNTDEQAMAQSPVQTKIQLGPTLTEGRGAGSKPNIHFHFQNIMIRNIWAFEVYESLTKIVSLLVKASLLTAIKIWRLLLLLFRGH